MSNIDLLKQELIKQKELIESMNGYVNVANINPTPSEITEGIKTVTGSLDLSIATATESDVTLGKTFYSGTTKLRTGMNQSDDFYNLYMYGTCSASELTPPNDVTTYTNYMFAYKNYDGTFYLGENVETLGNYAFGHSTMSNFSFEKNTKLTLIRDDAFYGAHLPINYSRLPDSIEKIGSRAFYNTIPVNDGYLRVPRNLASVGQYGLTSSVYNTIPDGIDWNSCPLTVINNYMFLNQSFMGTFTFPSNITSVKNSSCFNFLCNKVIVPSTVTYLDYNFYCVQNQYSSLVPKLDIIFNQESVSNFGGCPFYQLYAIADLSIYVPDNSIEEYRASNYFSSYVSYLKPMSQLPE